VGEVEGGEECAFLLLVRFFVNISVLFIKCIWVCIVIFWFGGESGEMGKILAFTTLIIFKMTGERSLMMG
jgi:hypothetical protein